MSVALLAVTKTISEEQRADDVRKDAIAKLLSMIEESAKKDPNFRGINVNRNRQVIDCKPSALPRAYPLPFQSVF
jgi:hypothetical protein